jgi:hypothetical protein
VIRRGRIGTNEEQAAGLTSGASGSAEPEGDFDIGVDSVRLREGEIEHMSINVLRHSSSSGTSGGQSYSMAGALDDESQFESESVSSVSSLEEDLDGGGGGASDDAEYTFDED